MTVNGRAIGGMSVYDTPIDVCFWGIADIDGTTTGPLCAGIVAVNDWDMSHGERHFCDIKTISVTMIVFSKLDYDTSGYDELIIQ